MFADISASNKKKQKTLLKDVFRPFDNFTNISKVYESCIYN